MRIDSIGNFVGRVFFAFSLEDKYLPRPIERGVCEGEVKHSFRFEDGGRDFDLCVTLLGSDLVEIEVVMLPKEEVGDYFGGPLTKIVFEDEVRLYIGNVHLRPHSENWRKRLEVAVLRLGLPLTESMEEAFSGHEKFLATAYMNNYDETSPF